MARAQERQTTRDSQIATVKTFISKNTDLPVAEKDLSSLSRLTDTTLNLLMTAAYKALCAEPEKRRLNK